MKPTENRGSMSVNGSEFSVVIEAQWANVTERIRLDYGSDSQLMQVHSREDWGDEGGTVIYRPRLHSQGVEDGCYRAELAYLEQDHADLSDNTRENVYWGTTRLKFHFDGTRPTLKVEDMWWTGDGSYHEDMDGSPKRVRIRLEEPSKLKPALVKVREGQRKFKEELCKLEKPPCCFISGETTKELLDAAHIVAVADGGSDEVENGVLLRADIHRLFDAGCFRIKPCGSLELGKDVELSESYRDAFSKWFTRPVSNQVLRRIELSLRKKAQLDESKQPEQ